MFYSVLCFAYTDGSSAVFKVTGWEFQKLTYQTALVLSNWFIQTY